MADGVQLYIQFGSQDIRRYAQDKGYIDTFDKAGVQLVDPSCGACIKAGPGVSFTPDEVTVSAINRNFPGRSGPGQLAEGAADRPDLDPSVRGELHRVLDVLSSGVDETEVLVRFNPEVPPTGPDSDPLAHFDFLPPPAELATVFRKQFAKGLSLIERCAEADARDTVV